ncbi:MAG: DinB family protein [Anaerolineae bacterium]
MTASNPMTPEELAYLLESSLEIIQSEADALGPDLMAWRPAEGAWSINEVIGHLIEADRRGFYGRIVILTTKDNPKLEAWDQEEVARERGDDEKDGFALLEEFTSLREDGIALVEGLTPEQLARVGQHPVVGELSVSDVLHEWIYHDRIHIQQILDISKALMWENMGAARKFSQPEI